MFASLASHISVSRSAAFSGRSAGHAGRRTLRPSDKKEGWYVGKQTKKPYPQEGTANKPLYYNDIMHPPMLEENFRASYTGRYSGLGVKRTFRPSQEKTPSDIKGRYFANTATALHGIHTRFPVRRSAERTHPHTTLFTFPISHIPL